MSRNLDNREPYAGTQVLGSRPHKSPLIICFHGSSDSCASWLPLAHKLTSSHQVLLYDRKSRYEKPAVTTPEMLAYLKNHDLPPPYVLIAHSYGGTFAREFLQRRPRDVAGMVLAETGQETALDAQIEEAQYKRCILGHKPLSVIRANSLIDKFAQLDALTAGGETPQSELQQKRDMLDIFDKEDERLKRRQLELSTNNQYVHVPDCGHGVIRDRPDIVAEEVRWVLENLVEESADRGGFVQMMRRLFHDVWAQVTGAER